MKYTVRVPATTANFASGFDSFGCALGIYNTYRIEPVEQGLYISGCPKRCRNERNLTVCAYRDVLQEAGVPFGGLRLDISAQIPVSRGLGSSAAMIVAGVLAANEELGRPFDLQKLLQIATRIEGHPDNLAPALFGGMTASMMEGGMPDTVSYSVAESLRIVVCVPDFPLPTARARQVLPEMVPLTDAVYDLSHGAVLLKALELGDAALIRRAMRDRLHQPYRTALIPEYDVVRSAALAEGALGFCISGAGPTLLALTDDLSFAERLKRRLADKANHVWKVLAPEIDRTGAVIQRTE